MTDDRTKLPDGMLVEARGWHTAKRPALFVVVDTREGGETEIVADAWEVVDRIRQQERERIADALIRNVNGPSDELWTWDDGDEFLDDERIAAWLRAGAKDE